VTALTKTQPVPFRSNEEYLDWEMRRLQQRLSAYIAARNEPSAVLAYHDLVAEFASTRLSAVTARQEATAQGTEIPFDDFVRRFELEAVDEEVLMICLATHLSATIWNLMLAAQGSALKTYIEVGFVSELLKKAPILLSDRAFCDPGSRLVKNGLIFVEPPKQEGEVISVLGQSVYAPHYVAMAVTGVPGLDERLTGFCELISPSIDLFDVVLSSETRGQVEEFVRGFHQRGAPLALGTGSWTLLVKGPRRCGKTSLAEGLAKAFGRPLFVMHLDQLERKKENAVLLRLAALNAHFLGAIVLLIQPEKLLGVDQSLVGTVTRLVSHNRGLTILEPHGPQALDEAFEPLIHFVIEIDRPDSQLRDELWESLLPESTEVAKDVNLTALASKFGLTGGQIRTAIDWAQQRATMRGPSSELTQGDLRAGAASQVRSKLEAYTDTSKVKLVMDDLVLPESTMEIIQEFLAACRNRQEILNRWGFGKRLVTGKGLVTLFTGDAGTGKTLCAEILANTMDLRLHIVSIPKVVSKWVGETEKNIREIFSHARAQNSMLLFDEADSLFAKRVKVERAQDHFQNMEVNMLLQEIERFEGIVILTTNFEGNIDRAFERRILFKIHFPDPEVDDRERLWKTLIPADTPMDQGIDFRILAEDFELNGGLIKNAVIRAAYRCLAENKPLSEEALWDAAKRQAQEAGKLTRTLDDDDHF
jgi:ATP-dependent 26S proteasome regulatory subunit